MMILMSEWDTKGQGGCGSGLARPLDCLDNVQDTPWEKLRLAIC